MTIHPMGKHKHFGETQTNSGAVARSLSLFLQHFNSRSLLFWRSNLFNIHSVKSILSVSYQSRFYLLAHIVRFQAKNHNNLMIIQKFIRPITDMISLWVCVMWGVMCDVEWWRVVIYIKYIRLFPKLYVFACMCVHVLVSVVRTLRK